MLLLLALVPLAAARPQHFQNFPAQVEQIINIDLFKLYSVPLYSLFCVVHGPGNLGNVKWPLEFGIDRIRLKPCEPLEINRKPHPKYLFLSMHYCNT